MRNKEDRVGMKGSRLHAIQDFVLDRRHVSLKELADRFEISMNTVRRDVDELLRWGAVEKVYGGVVANPHYRSYLNFGERVSTSTHEKDRIARAAAAAIEEDDIVMMDAGSTIADLAVHLDHTKSLTVITNNMAVVSQTAGSPNARLIVLGGEYSKSAHGFVGMETIGSMSNFRARKAFISVTGVLPIDGGITNAPSIEAEIKRAMIEASQECYLLVDSSKFGAVSLVNVVPWERIHHVVTDRQPNDGFLEIFKRYAIDLIVAADT